MKRKQMSESVLVYLALALSGGCMDAYSYLCRDRVFANAQTGNMLLFGVHLAEHDYAAAFKYLWPILAFSLGIVLSDLMRNKITAGWFHWRQAALIVEIAALFIASGLSQSSNLIANGLISFACGIQVESFRSMRGNAIATTMCIGNLRSGIFYFDSFLQNRKPDDLRKAGIYLGIILTFVLGAMIESMLIKQVGEKGLYFSVGMLMAAFILMIKLPQMPEPEEGFSGD